MRDTFLPPFQACAAEAASVMCAFNALNGTPSCASEQLLAGVLREQMGFEGFVVTDNRGERAGLAGLGREACRRASEVHACWRWRVQQLFLQAAVPPMGPHPSTPPPWNPSPPCCSPQHNYRTLPRRPGVRRRQHRESIRRSDQSGGRRVPLGLRLAVGAAQDGGEAQPGRGAGTGLSAVLGARNLHMPEAV